MCDHNSYLEKAIELAKESMEKYAGGPFGAVVVRDGIIVGRGTNRVTTKNDPTAHAEIMAIRDACDRLNTYQLDGCIIYSSCEPCPMCLGAIYWSRPDALYFGASRDDAAKVEFDDSFIYEEMAKPLNLRHIPSYQILREKAKEIFQIWEQKTDKLKY